MGISIIVAPLVRFRVEGHFTGESGQPQPFDFWLTMDRLRDVSEVQAAIDEVSKSTGQTPYTDALAPRVKAWEGPTGEGGAPLACEPGNVRSLLNLPGMALLVWTRWMRETGAQAKN